MIETSIQEKNQKKQKINYQESLDGKYNLREEKKGKEERQKVNVHQIGDKDIKGRSG